MAVLIVGGAGFIGSHVNQALLQRGYQTIVLDNLSKGDQDATKGAVFFQGEMSNEVLLEKIFSAYKIDAVMHFAAFTDVGESVHYPLLYYTNNVGSTLTLLNVMQRHDVSLFIFSSSAAVYGIPQQVPLTEEDRCIPINPYGESKWMVEKILKDMGTTGGMRSCCLRYFNAAGGDPSGALQYYTRKESNLIPLILNTLGNPLLQITLYGTDYSTPDGTCIRDYIHVVDLASAHIMAMEHLLKGAPSSIYNLGTGRGFSVKEVIQAVEKVTGQKVNVKVGPRREGDPPQLVADARKAERELGWMPIHSSLEEIIRDAWFARRNRV
jgi:UDP-glucose 4-epimerase